MISCDFAGLSCFAVINLAMAKDFPMNELLLKKIYRQHNFIVKEVIY